MHLSSLVLIAIIVQLSVVIVLREHPFKLNVLLEEKILSANLMETKILSLAWPEFFSDST